MQLHLSQTAFWDVNFNELDEDKHADFIIARIFQYGLLEDLKIVLKKFSDTQIKEALRSQRGMDKHTIDFAKILGYLD